MKIEMSMKITGLPRDGWIKTIGAYIDFDLHQDGYTIAEAIEIRDALTKVIEYASFGAPELAAEKPGPRVFAVGDPAPADIWKVKDREGDTWRRRSGGGWVMREADAAPYSWQYLLEVFAPITEVIEP